MKFCTNCGKEIEVGAKFCIACGAPQEVVKPQPQPAQQVPNQPVVPPVVPPTGQAQQIPPVQSGQPQYASVNNVKKKKKWYIPVIIVGASLIMFVAAFFAVNAYIGGAFTKEAAAVNFLEATYKGDARGRVNLAMSLKAINYIEETYDVSKKDMIENVSQWCMTYSKLSLENIKIEEVYEISDDNLSDNMREALKNYGAIKACKIKVSYDEVYNGGDSSYHYILYYTVYYANGKWYVLESGPWFQEVYLH